MSVSIHAPAWGATRVSHSRFLTSLFQFTLPRGERQGASSSATGMSKFQFTLPRGERPSIAPPSTGTAVFQFTLPRGERLEDFRALIEDYYSFNSRSRVGSDQTAETSQRIARRFNSRSRVGSDPASRSSLP